MILEKGELVTKVKALLEEERRTRERQRLVEEQEEQEALDRQREMFAENERAKQQKEGSKADTKEDEQNDRDGAGSPSGSEPPTIRGTAATLERTGLCVICQDEEANIAIVDCGCVCCFLTGECPLLSPSSAADILPCVVVVRTWS